MDWRHNIQVNLEKERRGVGYNSLMSHTIAVDIGGTQIRVAVYEPDSIKPIAHQRTCSLATQPGIYDRLAQAIESVWPKGTVGAIGIASPGPLDPHTGSFLLHPTFLNGRISP